MIAGVAFAVSRGPYQVGVTVPDPYRVEITQTAQPGPPGDPGPPGPPGLSNLDDIDAGTCIFDRRLATTATAIVTARTFFTTFVATKAFTCTALATFCTLGQTGGTLARMGLYSIAPDGSANFLSGTANDATLWNVTNTRYIRPLIDSIPIVVGTRYGFGTVWVGTGTGPSLSSSSNGANTQGLSFFAPAMQWSMLATADLPASVPTANRTASTFGYYAELMS